MNEPGIPSRREKVLGGLWGSLVGDALGVPVEFMSRDTIRANPVTDMRQYGTHGQPKGTWSDDGALILCTVDSLTDGDFDATNMGGRFVQWWEDGLWTATGDVFDIGNTTRNALSRIAMGTPAIKAGGLDDASNGNGSLMRILPVVLRLSDSTLESFVDLVEQASAITHGHARSRMSCVFYGLIIVRLLQGANPQGALDFARADFTRIYGQSSEFSSFGPLLEDDIKSMVEEEIYSTGYVLHTLHASIWCLLTTRTFHDCLLKAVNLGGDTDTTGCVAGGLAGVAYGVNSIPAQWIDALPRKPEVADLFERFCTYRTPPA
jgi:ADP-ribosyl-[dinitrogen reductase] hydrolase